MSTNIFENNLARLNWRNYLWIWVKHSCLYQEFIQHVTKTYLVEWQIPTLVGSSTLWNHNFIFERQRALDFHRAGSIIMATLYLRSVAFLRLGFRRFQIISQRYMRSKWKCDKYVSWEENLWHSCGSTQNKFRKFKHFIQKRNITFLRNFLPLPYHKKHQKQKCK